MVILQEKVIRGAGHCATSVANIRYHQEHPGISWAI